MHMYSILEKPTHDQGKLSFFRQHRMSSSNFTVQ